MIVVPAAVSLYDVILAIHIMAVVVAFGVTSRVPRGVTRPGSGLMLTPLGFSVAQTSVADWPG